MEQSVSGCGCVAEGKKRGGRCVPPSFSQGFFNIICLLACLLAACSRAKCICFLIRLCLLSCLPLSPKPSSAYFIVPSPSPTSRHQCCLPLTPSTYSPSPPPPHTPPPHSPPHPPNSPTDAVLQSVRKHLGEVCSRAPGGCSHWKLG